jgi:hypothetical protein
MSRSRWALVNLRYTDSGLIVFIQDLNLGGRSVTNDAEAVFLECQQQYGQCRVVYQDSEGEWAEITYANFAAFFKPWHGLVWDRLTKV